MKKFLILLCFVIILFACDRFEYNFEPTDDDENYISEFFNNFADSVSTFPEDIDAIMSFYHDNYNNNGVTKTDMMDFYEAFTYVNTPISLQAVLIDTTDNYEIEWQLIATETTSGQTYLDTVMTDVLLSDNDSFKFYGNQVNMRNIVVELFTGTWCTYCPFAEEALHNLREQYGSRLSYVEYHIGDPLDNGFSYLLNYYPNSATLPITVINGNAQIITGAGEDTHDEFEAVITPLLSEPLLAGLTEANAVIADNQLTGSVIVDLDDNISFENLKLVLILQEDTNTDYHNYNGDDLHNIVIKREVIDIEICGQVDFVISQLDDIASGYDELPEDLTLVIWIQTMDDPYNASTCKVHNVIEVSL